MFRDHPHSIEKINISNKLYFKKTCGDLRVLHKEYLVQKALEPTGLVPKILQYDNNYLIEESAHGKDLNNQPINEAAITQIAKSLRKIHSYPVNKKLKKFLVDDFTRSNLYQPRLIWNAIKQDMPKDRDFGFIESRIDSKIKQVEKIIAGELDKLSIVHGDLSKNNIFVDKTYKVTFIDWTDARYDIWSTDVSQFFYICDINSQLQNVFWEAYEPYENSKYLIELNILFLYLYDIAHVFREQLRVDDEKFTKLLTLLN